MKTQLTMVYWKSDQFWLGKLLEHPEIMTQGETFVRFHQSEIEQQIRENEAAHTTKNPSLQESLYVRWI